MDDYGNQHLSAANRHLPIANPRIFNSIRISLLHTKVPSRKRRLLHKMSQYKNTQWIKQNGLTPIKFTTHTIVLYYSTCCYPSSSLQLKSNRGHLTSNGCIDRVPYFLLTYYLKVPFSYLHATMTLFIILRQPVTISVTVFSNLTKID